MAAARRVAAISLASILIASAAHAIPPRSIAAVDEDGLIAMTDTGGLPVRRQITLDVTPARPVAWDRFVARAGTWRATWDRATGVPSRLWGPGIAAPGASADADVAARAALAVITEHLDLLAPGAEPADLALVANHWDGSMRTVGFAQSRGGLRVVGGQVSVRIKNDKIFVISSQALPDVAAAMPQGKRLAAGTLAEHARRGMDHALALPAGTTIGTPGEAVILPLVGDDRVLAYRVVQPVVVDAGAEGAWTAFADPVTGEVVARRQELMYVSVGELKYDVVERWTGRSRMLAPAGGVAVLLEGQNTYTSPTGQIIWGDDQSTVVTAFVTGLGATVIDETGELGSAQISVPPSGIGVWSAATDERLDAQINGYIHARVVREFAKAHFANDLSFLYDPVEVHVNINDQCNAYSNGTAIHFFLSSPPGSQIQCENTARIADVVYHEYGHSIHRHAIIDGVGAFDGAMSEGLSDFLSAAITEDSGMGRGFFKTDEPLRELDPVGSEAIWPRDISEIHTTGLIFGGTWWDLRKRLIADLGPDEGKALTLRLYYAAVQRATDIPSSLIEALAADDDDGDLTNGTPHECTIRAEFGRHGMRTVSGRVIAPGAVVAIDGQTAAPIQVQIEGLSPTCGDAIDRVDVGWHPGVGGTPAAGAVQATQNGSDYTADVPLPNDGGRVDFQAQISFSDGTTQILPDNPGDEYYQMYQGETVELYCTDFETDPFAEGWEVTTRSGVADFEWGPASTQFSATDPPAAYSGDHIIGLGIGYDYADETATEIALPPIDVGQYSDVLVQYRRWLAVEDGFFDHAVIRANGEPAWSNFDSQMGNSSSTHHIDREWRFQSVPVSTRFSGTVLNLSFRLDSDQGLHFGGWSLDDLCVVANPASICGDGVRSATEECDEGAGNADEADVCRTYCRLPACGDGILDAGEECEPGIDEGCLPACIRDEEGGGCCSSSGDPTGLLLAGPLVFVISRRRRGRSGKRV
jgi:hypothetical protein